MKLITEKSTKLGKLILCCISDLRGFSIPRSFDEKGLNCVLTELWCLFKVIIMFLTPWGSHGSWNAHFYPGITVQEALWGNWGTLGTCDVGWLHMGLDIPVLVRSHGQIAWFGSTSGAWEKPGLQMGAWEDLISCSSQELLLHKWGLHCHYPLQQSSGMTLPLAPETICPNFPVLLFVFNFEKQLSALFPYHDFYVSSIYFGYRIKLTSSSFCRLGPLQLSSTKFVYKQEGAAAECLIFSSIKLTIA